MTPRRAASRPTSHRRRWRVTIARRPRTANRESIRTAPDRVVPVVNVETPPERYVDARELACRLGVSPSTITRWVCEGCPSETWGMKRTRRFLVSQVIAWRQSLPTMRQTRDAPCIASRQPRTEGVSFDA